MKRKMTSYLKNWLASKDRKPLIIRGARQVGKTWLVRHFAKESQKEIIELNFERDPSYATLMNSNSPQEILLNLSALINKKIIPEQSLLFLDEIQAAPNFLSKLRWFAEELPQLPVIAAGSLLEFILESHSFSMPVGRVNYVHLEPLSFEEFLLANDKTFLYEYLLNYHFGINIPDKIHFELISLFKEYIFIGGMPASVVSWITEHSLEKIHQIQHDLLATYRDDFAKYKGRLDKERLDEVILAVPRMLGKKFVYSQVNQNISLQTIKQVLDLFSKARLCHFVWGCAANGVPLAAELKSKYFKEIFLDVGLCCALLGLGLRQIYSLKEIILVNQGAIAEQVVGQLLRTIELPFIEPMLYCWHREEAGSSAEIDYCLQHEHHVVPIEVKAGTTGTLKSLHIFMGLKKYSVAMRINSDLPSQTKIDVNSLLQQERVKYQLLSIPFYLIGQIHRLLDLSYAGILEE